MDVKEIIEKSGFKILEQILYYNGKIIGFNVLYDNEISNEQDDIFKGKTF